MNRIMLIGRLTRDVEIRYSQGENPTAVTRYTLAVNRPFKRKGEQEADFLPCIAFGKTAEFAEKYLAKEMRVAVEGRIQTGQLYQPGMVRKSIRRTLWWNVRSFWRREPITGSKALTMPTITKMDV